MDKTDLPSKEISNRKAEFLFIFLEPCLMEPLIQLRFLEGINNLT